MSGFELEFGLTAVQRMCSDMSCRGPDDEGVESFGSGEASVIFGSRRLAIIDLSPLGHMPMVDSRLGLAIVFNGMIYNFAELRRELISLGETFESDSDTEVVLKAYAQYGRDCVRHLRGMFAFAIWDPRTETVFLARDRLGIKPLYLYEKNGQTTFASQVKTLIASGVVPFVLDPDGVESYLATAAVAEPMTIVEGVRALPAGHCATIGREGVSTSPWWDFPAPGDDRLNRREAVSQLQCLLREAVSDHLVSDAPIGVFLSGGLDSSLIASLATEQSAHLRTLSVTFSEEQYSEHTYVDAVVRRLGTDHSDIRLSATELLASSQDAFSAMDQPSYDGMNVFVVSRAASAIGLKVALSGLGADELFNGYGFAQRIVQLERFKKAPRLLASVGGVMLGRLPGSRAAKPAAWLRDDLASASAYELLRRVFLPWEIENLMPGRDGQNRQGQPRSVENGRHLGRELAVAEISSYMRDVLLRDTDAMSMSQGLEVRVPLLDDRIVDWSLRLPPDTTDLSPKTLLREAAKDLVPEEILTRPKQGFVLPLEHWMRHQLKSTMDDLFNAPPAELGELVDPEAVLDIWRRYIGEGASGTFSSAQGWLRPWSLYVLYQWTTELHSALPTPMVGR